MPEDQFRPEDLARQAAVSVASDPSEVGEFLAATDLEDGVREFRFASHIKGYEGWVWLLTLYHDLECDRWTVDESSLIPGHDALLPPKWVPWKDRLLPSDLSVTDSMGTDQDDPRLEDGLPAGSEAGTSSPDDSESDESNPAKFEMPTPMAVDQQGSQPDSEDQTRDQQVRAGQDWIRTSVEDWEQTVQEFALSRRHVLSELGRQESAKRWYEGQHGPKSLSTRTAEGKVCANCGFLLPLDGEMGTMFGVCANRWSPDDGRVVSLDHGCGEHSEIEPPEASHLWVQSKPAFDDLHIDVVHQAPRDENPAVELLEQMSNEDETADTAITDTSADALGSLSEDSAQSSQG